MNNDEMYKIKVIKWFEHNPKAKKTYKATMIRHSLINDAKVNALSMSNKWLFINLLLICGDHANDTITLTKRQVNDILTTREGAYNALKRLESLQLVSIEKMPLIELKERKRKELKGNSVKGEVEKSKSKKQPEQVEMIPASPPAPKEPAPGQFAVAKYKMLWKNSFGDYPPLRKQDTAELAKIAHELGVGEVEKLLDAYFRMPDNFFIRRRYDVQTFTRNLPGIQAFIQTGRVVTQAELRTLDNRLTNANTIQALKDGEI